MARFLLTLLLLLAPASLLAQLEVDKYGQMRLGGTEQSLTHKFLHGNGKNVQLEVHSVNAAGVETREQIIGFNTYGGFTARTDIKVFQPGTLYRFGTKTGQGLAATALWQTAFEVFGTNRQVNDAQFTLVTWTYDPVTEGVDYNYLLEAFRTDQIEPVLQIGEHGAIHFPPGPEPPDPDSGSVMWHDETTGKLTVKTTSGGITTKIEIE